MKNSNNSKFLIGLYGHMGSGKDTVSSMMKDVLNSHGISVEQDAFANPLKEILIEHFGFSNNDLYTQEGKKQFNKFWGFTNREAAQRFGTEAVRNGFHQDAWFKAMQLRLQKSVAEVIIISDLRFENECKFIKENNGITVRINRPIGNTVENVGIKNHESEQDLPEELFDCDLNNIGTLEDLKNTVINFVNNNILPVFNKNEFIQTCSRIKANVFINPVNKYEFFDKKWIKYFFKLAKEVSTVSKDPNTKVGAVCIDPKTKRVLATGYNGFPSGVIENDKRWERPIKYDRVVHAEANCIAAAARFGIRLDNTAIFITHPPCVDCTKLLISAGIKQIYFIELENNNTSGEWKNKLYIADSMCEETNTMCVSFTEHELE